MVSRTFSADTTVRECLESIAELWSLYKESQSDAKYNFHLWDCTYNPPKEITDLPIQQYPDVEGARSQTLQNAGWFPSGTLVAAPAGMKPSNFSKVVYDDEQYNRSRPLEMQKSGMSKVEFSNMDSRPAPSQVLGAVSDRFSDDWDVQTAQAQAVRLQNKRESQQRQQERQDKLDQRIQLLEQTSSSKNAKVSAQVRSMLIRSRATGDERLVPEDRVYFECYLDKGLDSELVREFRYFSPQESMSGIVRALGMTPQGGNAMVELLVKRPSSIVEPTSQETSAFVYRQLPSLMRIYEAKSEGFMTGDLDTLVIRWFNDVADATESVNIENTTVTADAPPVNNTPETPVPTTPMDTETSGETPMEEDVFQEIAIAIKSMDEASLKGKKPKKASAAAIKVRQLQIKSKAKGDTKRIPKMEDRFFLEFVKIDSNDGSASSSFNFLGRNDSLNRVGQTLGLLPDEWIYLVPVVQGENTDRYTRIIDPSIKLTETQSSGLLQPFDRVVLVSKGRLL